MTSVRDRAEDDRRELPVRPTDEDPLAARASDLIGGPAGRWAMIGGHRWWNPLRVMVLVVIGMFALGMAQKASCYSSGWFQGGDAQYIHACYSDIPHLYAQRGFATDLVPYFDRIPDAVSSSPDIHYLEYPVLTGLFMEVASWLTPHGSPQHSAQIFWIANSAMLMICAVALVVCVARTNRRRPWDGLLIALSPALALTATINWDLFAVALVAAATLLWSRRHPAAAGVLIGLAACAKIYPVLLLAALFILCLRAGRMRQWVVALGGAAVAWILVNLPVMLLAPDGWAQFYTFSQNRHTDYGSFWLIIMERSGNPLTGVNAYATALMLLLSAGIAAIALYASRRPRLGQLAFLLVAALVISDKVYSPQYVLWLLPLAVLARPRWRDLLIWQGAEVLYLIGIWMRLAYVTGTKHHGLTADAYHLAIAVHLLGLLYLCGLVVRDILLPEHDVLRQGGEDDPTGGVLDGAEDVFVLGTFPQEPQYAAPDGP
ncbi:glycosyltransferase family 87 protein [Actinacidiphila sp. ITFR-21]|uniref:glycosyltransferase family 87 protein n=1 Tax=Actinacidiphila sp. ITFR-21 TaxID=3075199 RepID=UPI00288BF1BD|nr:glycosyltransferase 87 family protein [Streptomyces sp. ITFR-21]WNI16594.1 glycosyltransferase 87 family protein [Streptomyces sp. ITFR-21]